MIYRRLDAGYRCAWVLADAAYGCDHGLRRMLEERDQAHVPAVRGNHHLRFIGDSGFVETNPSELAGDHADGDWTALAAGEGSKGPRLYGWARIIIPWNRKAGWERCLLVRRSRSGPRKLAYCLAFCPGGAAGLRLIFGECFQRAKDGFGLDHCVARSWHSWHRHVSLVMAAAFLARLEAQLRRGADNRENTTIPAAGSAGLPS